jgi:hypothetical protein
MMGMPDSATAGSGYRPKGTGPIRLLTDVLFNTARSVPLMAASMRDTFNSSNRVQSGFPKNGITCTH